MPSEECEQVAAEIEKTWIVRENSLDTQERLLLDVKIDQLVDRLRKKCKQGEELFQALLSKLDGTLPGHT
jgi:hypothetical protein